MPASPSTLVLYNSDVQCIVFLCYNSESVTSRTMALSIGTRALTQLVVGNLGWTRVNIVHENDTGKNIYKYMYMYTLLSEHFD